MAPSVTGAAAEPVAAPAGWSVGVGGLEVMTGRAVRRYLQAYGVAEAPVGEAPAALVGVGEAVPSLGVRIGANCQEGMCGSCKIVKLEGDVDMHHQGDVIDVDA